jgi:hypothetical protein
MVRNRLGAILPEAIRPRAESVHTDIARETGSAPGPGGDAAIPGPGWIG